MKEVKHIIFDLDGTLIDSRNEIISTYKKVFKEIVPPTLVNYESINYGATLQTILDKIYDNDSLLVSKAKVKFSELYDNSNYEDTTLYPNVFENIEELFKNNFVLHIATNKRLIPTVKILKSKNLFSFFTCIKSSDFKQGFTLSKAEMVRDICNEYKITRGAMIGDSSQDIEAGLLSNLMTVGVLYGYEKKEELLRNNPKFVINQFTELNTILLKEL